MKTILYIEDSPVSQRLIERVLRPYYRVILANDGLDALGQCKSAPPALVLTDLGMPGLDGYEIATRLKAIWPQVPVVALTADNREESRRLALIAGCDGWLTKSIAPPDLLAAVEKYLNGAVETLSGECCINRPGRGDQAGQNAKIRGEK